ncbi:hypothetical protein HDA39_000169 [Kribbella italica]|uniref:Uncharacterized protein n=1 Tax=Kribbella italica TaxID=1540520 RepID=A0A7W9J138_9ACTN|nr:hypothetical protein [Kribbella italica]
MKHTTRKTTPEAKRETLRRRQVRAIKTLVK